MPELIRREFVVNMPPGAAWNYLAQVEKWTSWAKHIRKVELTPRGELTSESSGVFLLVGGMRSTFRMSVFNPPRNWTWVGSFLWLTITYDHIFEPQPHDCTRLIWTVAAEGFGAAVFGRLFALIYNANLNRAIPRLITEMNGN